MKKGTLIVSCCALFLSSSIYAFTKYDRIAFQGVLTASNGQAFTGFGIVDYGRWFELGMDLAGYNNNGRPKTSLFLPMAFGGLRFHIKECTYFAWGLNYASKVGTDSGYHIQSDYSVGPYIALEQWLTNHVMLVGYINPYRYEHEVKQGCNTFVSNQYFSSGGIALNYVLDHFPIPYLDT